jgi:hypothetical protein
MHDGFNKIRAFLGIQPEDVPNFGIMTLLFFSLQFSAIFLTNYAETAFLKRYGVQYLPEVFLLNGALSFFVLTFVGLMLKPFPLTRILAVLLIGFGGLVLGIKALIPLAIYWIYPVLYVLKIQIPAIYLMLFWNLCNDLFHTRQAKRLFPLILAGGALGTVLGSFLTAPLGRAIGMDALLTFYGLLMACTGGCVYLYVMGGRQMPDHLPAGQIRRRPEPLRDILRLFHQIPRHSLLRVLILLTLVPNIMLPLLNFQFSFILNGTFAAETTLLNFYSWFRGVSHILTFAVLLITPRIYQKLGVPNSLLFHPFNYFLVFGLLMFSFALPCAIYARVSTSLLRSTLNNPGRGVLVGLLPADLRSVIRPVLRGTIAKTGSLLGALILLVSKGWLSPQDLCWIGICLSGCWALVGVRLKKSYGNYLLGSLERSHMDIRVMEEDDLRALLKDATATNLLMEHIRVEDGQRCSWFAGLLARSGKPPLMKLVLEVLPQKDPSCQASLIGMLPRPLSDDFVDRMVALAPRVDPEVLPVLIRRVGEEGCDNHKSFLESQTTSTDPRARLEAMVGLYRCEGPAARGSLRERILAEADQGKGPPPVWLLSALGRTGDPAWVPWLKQWTHSDIEEAVVKSAMEAICQLGTSDEVQDLLQEALRDPRLAVREAAIHYVPRRVGETMLWSALEDSDPRVRRIARARLAELGRVSALKFYRGISHHLPQLRREMILLAEKIDLPPRLHSMGTLRCLRRAYGWDRDMQSIEGLTSNPGKRILSQHLRELRWLEIETGLLLCGLQDPERRMWRLVDELQSGDRRMRSNAVEAVEYFLPRHLGRLWIPLLDEAQRDLRERVAKELLERQTSREESLEAFLDRLSRELTPVGEAALIWMLGGPGIEGPSRSILIGAAASEDAIVSEAAHRVLGDNGEAGQDERGNGTMMTTIEKVIYLKEVELFEDLTIEELATIADVTREEEYPEGEILFREGDPGGSFFLVIRGEVEAIKSYGRADEFLFRRVLPNDNFGCMGIFDRLPRAATAKAVKPTHLLVIDRQSLLNILQELPSISIKINAVLSRRVRILLEQTPLGLQTVGDAPL